MKPIVKKESNQKNSQKTTLTIRSVWPSRSYFCAQQYELTEPFYVVGARNSYAALALLS